MRTFSHPKINIGLNILKKREDGFHNIETIFYPIDNQFDIIKINKNGSGISLKIIGSVPLKVDQNNLCIKAVKILQRTFPFIDGLSIELTKNIPIGTGLGGGSSNGASVLRMLNEMYNLSLSVDELKIIAGELGSDVPFFIEEKPSFATGRGEILEPISVSLEGKKISIITPSISISTAEAYRKSIPGNPIIPLREAIKYPIKEWRDSIFNDFEKVLFPQYPELKIIKDRLYEQGADYVSLSGSGSAIYAIGNEIYHI
jgi:4-diphosphocytidyl-2-C-methyl-D-erythritol kinase